MRWVLALVLLAQPAAAESVRECSDGDITFVVMAGTEVCGALRSYGRYTEADGTGTCTLDGGAVIEIAADGGFVATFPNGTSREGTCAAMEAGQ